MDEEMKIINLADKVESKNSTLSQLISVSRAVSLKQPADLSNYIASIDKIVRHENSYYILDTKFSCLSRFDSTGQFLNSIGHLGDDPNSYHSVEDFLVDSVGVIHLLSNDSQCIMKFSAEGNFISKTIIDFFAFKFALWKNGYVFYKNYNGTYDQNNLITTNEKGNITNRFLPYDKTKQTNAISYSGHLQKYEGSIYVSNAYNPKIYRLNSDNELSTILEVDFGVSAIPNSIIDNFPKISQNIFNYSYMTENIIKNGSYLIIRFVSGRDVKNLIYNIETSKFYSFGSRTSSDFLEKIFWAPVSSFSSKGFIATIRPESFIYFKNNEPESFQAFLEQGGSLSKELNQAKIELEPIFIEFEINDEIFD